MRPPSETRQRWLAYLAERTGTYEWRTLRYSAVYTCLDLLGLRDHDLIVDVGAGMCDFDRYLRQTCNFDGRYVPVDGAIDGTELETWVPPLEADFYVSIETLEHLADPWRLLDAMQLHATKGVVLTTPNPAECDVYGMDATHQYAIEAAALEAKGFRVDALNLFGKGHDTLVAYRRPASVVDLAAHRDHVHVSEPAGLIYGEGSAVAWSR